MASPHIKVKKTELFHRRLTQEEFDDLKESSRNVFHFATRVKVIHPLRGKVPFELYPFQKSTLWYFLMKRFNIVLKFRQAGITELICLFCLWLAMYHSNKNILIISIKERVAKKMLRRIKFMYENLPDYLKQPVVNGRGEELGTATELEFANGSMITSIPTTEEAGRSEAVSLMIIDEAAIVRWINRIWAASFPTLSTGGSAIVNSTPYGVGNWFHKQWVDACSGASNFNPIRLKWQMHPERDDDWYQVMRKELGPRKTAQEIDGDFLTSGNSVFNLADIKGIEDCLDDYPPLERRLGGKLRIYKKYKRGINCYIGGDVATGRANDFSAFSIMDSEGEEYASFKGKIAPTRFADLLARMGWEFGGAVVAPESNDIGLAVTSQLEENGYPHLYYSRALVKSKDDSGRKKVVEEKIPGWYTTKKNRPIIINNLEEDVRNDEVLIKDPEFCREAYTFIYDVNNKPIAMGKKSQNQEGDLDEQVYNDDAILAKAITNHIRKGRKKGITVLPI